MRYRPHVIEVIDTTTTTTATTTALCLRALHAVCLVFLKFNFVINIKLSPSWYSNVYGDALALSLNTTFVAGATSVCFAAQSPFAGRPVRSSTAAASFVAHRLRVSP